MTAAVLAVVVVALAVLVVLDDRDRDRRAAELRRERRKMIEAAARYTDVEGSDQ